MAKKKKKQRAAVIKALLHGKGRGPRSKGKSLSSLTNTCPHCGTPVMKQRTHCWYCGREMPK